jgi:hypothetical protein
LQGTKRSRCSCSCLYRHHEYSCLFPITVSVSKSSLCSKQISIHNRTTTHLSRLNTTARQSVAGPQCVRQSEQKAAEVACLTALYRNSPGQARRYLSLQVKGTFRLMLRHRLRCILGVLCEHSNCSHFKPLRRPRAAGCLPNRGCTSLDQINHRSQFTVWLRVKPNLQAFAAKNAHNEQIVT